MLYSQLAVLVFFFFFSSSEINFIYNVAWKEYSIHGHAAQALELPLLSHPSFSPIYIILPRRLF